MRKKQEKPKIKKTLLKTKIKFENKIFYPISKTEYFRHSDYISKYEGNERIRKTGEINLFEKRYDSAEEIFLYLTEKEDNPENRFYLFLNDLKNPEKEIPDINFSKYVSDIVNDLFEKDNVKDFLKNLFENEKFAFKDKIMLIYLMSKAVNKENAEKLYPVFEEFEKNFKKKITNKPERIVFDIKYAEFLIKAGKKRKAIKILNKILKDLPDETVFDLLPPENLDITSNESGKLLKITTLKLLSKAKEKENSPSEIRKIVLLQPLNEEILQKLVETDNKKLKQKAEDAITVLNGDLFANNEDIACPDNYKPLKNNDIKNLSYSRSFTENFVYELQKRISKIKQDDYNAVKNYSEKINPDNHKTLYSVLKNTAEVFGIKDIEFYISKGEKDSEIIGYEGNPPFILTGNSFLDENSNKHLNLCELRFIVASETAHIYFKHTKLTATDVWRGLAEKGIAAVGTISTLAPIAGLLGKFVKKIPDIKTVSVILQGTASGVSGGKAILDAAIGFSDFFDKKNKTKIKKEKSLLAVSRLMQFTADKFGLLLCGNLTSAVKSILITENTNKEVGNISLKEFLRQKDEKGNFVNQNTALRIANIFSFYFSDEFDLLRKKLEKS